MADRATLDELLQALDQADAALRAAYRELAEDPDRTDHRALDLAEMYARRLELAQRVGLAALAQKRAAVVETPIPARATPPVEAPPPPAPSSGRAVESIPQSAAPSERASGEDVAQWASRVRSSGLGSGLKTELSTSSAWPLVLNDLMGVIGVPRDLSTTVGVIEELEGLDVVATPERQEAWARLPKHVQQRWLSMLVARTRALKELPSATPGVKGRVKTIIGRYPAWASQHMPGHVNGMKVTHSPEHGSWADDARTYWAELADRVGEELESPPASAPGRKRPKRAMIDKDDAPDIEESWPLWPRVRGLKVIVVGGTPVEASRDRLERAFQLASLDWPSIDGPRRVDAVAGRIEKGAYGLVLVLGGFVAHKESGHLIEAAKDAGVPCAIVDGGYGVAAVRAGIERFLGGGRGGHQASGS